MLTFHLDDHIPLTFDLLPILSPLDVRGRVALRLAEEAHDSTCHTWQQRRRRKTGEGGGRGERRVGGREVGVRRGGGGMRRKTSKEEEYVGEVGEEEKARGR